MSIDVHWLPLIFSVFLSISKICYCLLFIILVVPRCVMFFIWFHGVFYRCWLILIDFKWLFMQFYWFSMFYGISLICLTFQYFFIDFYVLLCCSLMYCEFHWVSSMFLMVSYGVLLIIADSRWCSLIWIGLYWFSLIVIDLHWF